MRVQDSSASTSRIAWPYLSSLVSPTPLICLSSSRVDGGEAAMSRRVASWKITYGGMPSSLATDVRHARSRSNTGAPRRAPLCARRARDLRRIPPEHDRPLAPHHLAAQVGQRQRPVVALDREQPGGEQLPYHPAPLDLGQLAADTERGQGLVPVG